ncbi:MarR family winged helix-turn-helix transcriptional regulator [Streptomyces sp. NRRL F-5123]|uniref:MarR family winged helix-turn-helix transcriptional regulator n=1 Tax=Streptomyces sp. NRRL F-5123 TaxID=1463856 RepID=UPI00099B8BE8|nr:MarR family winged helix-turn-helix transcriptional regulator [Streptomyces sp. NRRL F-5123]
MTPGPAGSSTASSSAAEPHGGLATAASGPAGPSTASSSAAEPHGGLATGGLATGHSSAAEPHGGLATGGLATGHSSAEESTGLLLWQVTNRWQAAQRAALKPYGLTHVQFVLLASLTYLQAAEAPAPVTQRRLADHAATDPMMTSQVLRALEARGLLTRDPHPHDARARTLSVTPEGRSLANAAVAAAEACDAAFFAPLTAAGAAFAEALRLLRAGG